MREHEEMLLAGLELLLELAFVALVYWGITACAGWDFTLRGIAGAWLVRQLVSVRINVDFREDEEK